MRKTYISPAVREVKIGNRDMLMASVNPDAIMSNDKGIKYGGIDEEGTLDPSARLMELEEEDDWE